MSKLLTQQEMDVLLMDAATVGDVSGNLETQGRNIEAKKFDFQRPHQLPENQLQALQTVNKKFAVNVEKYFFSNLEKQISINPLGTNSLYLSEYLLTITNPTAAYVFTIDQYETSGLIEFNSNFAVSTVVNLLGGRQESEIKPRALTILEQRVFKNIADKILVELQAAWQKHGNNSFSIDRFETCSENLQISIPTEVMLITSFEVNYEKQKFNFNIIYPAAALMKMIAHSSFDTKGNLKDQKYNKHYSEFVKQQLYQTTLSGVAVLGTSSVSIRELLELKPGDIIRTKIPVNGEVNIIIGNKLNIKGKPGVSNGHLAISVTRTSTESAKEK